MLDLWCLAIVLYGRAVLCFASCLCVDVCLFVSFSDQDVPVLADANHEMNRDEQDKARQDTRDNAAPEHPSSAKPSS